MTTKYFIILITLHQIFVIANSVDVECIYEIDSWDYVDNVYTCSVHKNLKINSKETAQIDSVNGLHKIGKSNNDVVAFEAIMRGIQFFPRKLENLFTNLVGIRIWYGKLTEIHQIDLKPLAMLEYIDLNFNSIESLESGLFDFNHKLGVISMQNNKIHQIGSNVFDGLNKLAYLLLNLNKCIDMEASNDTEAVKRVIDNVKIKCSSF